MNEADLTAELVARSTAADDRRRRAARVAATVRRFGGYRWVGVYDVTADQIAVIGWSGPAPPAHPRFPREHGLCGAAVAAGEAVIVGDVAADPRYLTTHTTTRSEIVVPVFRGGVVVGLIDVESERPNDFGESDRQLLERCAAVIVPLWRTDGADAEVAAKGRRGA
ncbi:MAG: GAF domain-containing protein [Gemmatimonadota bacterium]|nr:GAF domain-containing protein [Gemmatimonadota bacterium]